MAKVKEDKLFVIVRDTANKLNAFTTSEILESMATTKAGTILHRWLSDVLEMTCPDAVNNWYKKAEKDGSATLEDLEKFIKKSKWVREADKETAKPKKATAKAEPKKTSEAKTTKAKAEPKQSQKTAKSTTKTATAKTETAKPKKTAKTDEKPKKTAKTEPKKTAKAEPKKSAKTEPKKTAKAEPKNDKPVTTVKKTKKDDEITYVRHW